MIAKTWNPTLGRLRHKGRYRFKTSLGFPMRPCQKQNEPVNNKNSLKFHEIPLFLENFPLNRPSSPEAPQLPRQPNRASLGPEHHLVFIVSQVRKAVPQKQSRQPQKGRRLSPVLRNKSTRKTSRLSLPLTSAEASIWTFLTPQHILQV